MKYATIANDEAHFAGRTGMGAVMGAKRLKALAVRGGGQVPLADAKAFAEARKAVRALSVRIGLPQKLREAGVPREALPECGEAALSDGSIVYNPRPADAASLTELLEAAW